MRAGKAKRRFASGREIAAKRLHIYRCTKCGHVHREKVPACQQCGYLELDHFDSLGELHRFAELEMLQRGGAIHGLERQVRLTLHAYAPVPGNRRKLGHVTIDFGYGENDAGGISRQVWEDYKPKSGSVPVMTDLSHWKFKHVEAEYGCRIRITNQAL